jgi:small GTP-binding protein
MLGTFAVGKTSILSRAETNNFDPTGKSTIGAMLTDIHVQASGVSVVLHVWDTAGHEKYRATTKMYLRDAAAGLLVFAIDDLISFQSVETYATDLGQGARDAMKILVANKIDLNDKRVVSTEQGAELAQKLGAKYMEVSAATGQGISDLFELVAEEVTNQQPTDKIASGVVLVNEAPSATGGCC